MQDAVSRRQTIEYLAICIFFTLSLLSFAFAQTEVPSSPPVEPPKQKMNIEVKDNLLSVDLLDVEFGSVMKSIGEKVNFKVEITGNVLFKKISTNFKDMHIERGILRLISLTREKNYFMYYDSKGLLSKLEMGGSSFGGSQGSGSWIDRAMKDMQRSSPPPVPTSPVPSQSPASERAIELPPQQAPPPPSIGATPVFPAAPLRKGAPPVKAPLPPPSTEDEEDDEDFDIDKFFMDEEEEGFDD
jgi:hypothetical protein